LPRPATIQAMQDLPHHEQSPGKQRQLPEGLLSVVCMGFSFYFRDVTVNDCSLWMCV
jgi:hypothetical protein